jgi:hypothetical protein
VQKKFLVMVGAVGMVAVSVSAGTFALFSANSGPHNNTVTAGTLALESWRDQGDTVPGPMFYTTPAEGNTGAADGLLPTGLWAPGDEHHRVLLVRNTGSLDAWLTSVGAELQAGSSLHLAQKLAYKVTTDAAGTAVIASGTLADLINTDVTFPAPIALDTTLLPVPMRPPKPFHFWVSLPLDANNSYQGLTLRVDFHINAEQKENNP